jgi:hypothetical protein
MIPVKILLTYYQTTRARLGRASLPYGVSMTKWINDAICEKLDREQPETIGAVPVEIVKPVETVKPMESVQRMEGGDFWGESEKVRELVKRHAR